MNGEPIQPSLLVTFFLHFHCVMTEMFFFLMEGGMGRLWMKKETIGGGEGVEVR